MKLNKILLVLFFLLGLGLRLIKLDNLPSILNRDEAALAYNAFLIKETGMDEWQAKLPLTFKSFGDYKLPGYPYLLAFLFSFLPNNDFVTRLPSALAGSLLIVLAFYFAKEVLKIKNSSALLLSLLIALNPVFFFYSRIAFEANLALLLFVASLFFSLRTKKNYYLAAILMFLAILTYNTPLLLLPFILPVIIWQDGLKKYKSWLLPLILFMAIFLFGFFNFYALVNQKSGITVFNDQSLWQEFALYRQSVPENLQTVFANKYLFYGKEIGKNFLDSFSLDFLVTKGGTHPWHSLPATGHLFYLTYFLAILMMIDLLGELLISSNDKKLRKRNLLCLYLAIIALAPSVVTVDSPHATRSLFFFFMLACLATIFTDKLTTIFSRQKNIILILIFSILAIENYIYCNKYFLSYPKNQPISLFSEYKKLLFEAENDYPNQEIAVIDEGGYQYILTAWYLKLPSSDFFSTIKYQDADAINFYYGERLLNYHFIKSLADRDSEEKIVLDQKLGLIKYE